MNGFSVVVPAHAAWPLLHRTLAAVFHDLGRIDAPAQVLVVDNDSPTSLTPSVLSLARSSAVTDVRVLRREGLQGPFEPGAARNLAIEEARYDALVFLDADSVPAPRLFERYADALARRRDTVFLGHREFVDASALAPEEVARNRSLLDELPRVMSDSNYGQSVDRRWDELLGLDEHSRPYNCLFGCNFAVHRALIGDARFREEFDGHWGYEDIEFGYQLHVRGARFEYVPEAFVYHQEGLSMAPDERARGKKRNF